MSGSVSSSALSRARSPLRVWPPVGELGELGVGAGELRAERDDLLRVGGALAASPSEM
jgi:hypothetical protein